MDPTPKDLKAKRHRALVRAIDEMCDQLRREVSDPSWFDETEALWTDELFRAARCSVFGLRIRCRFEFSSADDQFGFSLNGGLGASYIVDREVFADTGRREHEHREILMENLAPVPNKAGNEHK